MFSIFSFTETQKFNDTVNFKDTLYYDLFLIVMLDLNYI